MKYVFRVCAFRTIFGIAMLAVLLLTGGAGAAALTMDDSGMMHMRIQHDIDNDSDNMSIYMLQLHGRLEANGTHFELNNSQ